MAKADDIILFVNVVDEGSFSKVAQKLNLTNSVVSKRIARLESDLNVQLLYRSTRKLNLTDAGRTLYNKARIANLAIQDAEDAVSGYSDEVRGKIRITMPNVSAKLVLNRAIAEFCNLHEEVDVELAITNRVTNIIEEGYDLAIRTAHLEDSSLIAKRLLDSKWIVCASSTYLKNKSRPNYPDDLTEHNCLIYKYDSTGPDFWPFHIEGELHNVQIDGRMQSNNLDALRQAAIAGVGVAFLPKALVHEDIEDGALSPLLVEYVTKTMGIYAVYPRSRQPDKKLKLLVNYLQEAFGNRSAYFY